ncbi:MAG: hypothetical protein HY067_15430 [Betaproteobacteria bacterium]|nr:hypothetical protein [Betaproteobacteria bacterium]
MMDFLRRLAPPREGDRARAVAVLPSRFAGDAPLRSASTPSDVLVTFDDAPAPSSAQTPSPEMYTAAPERFIARTAQRAPVGPEAVDGAQPVASAPLDTPHVPPRESTSLMRPTLRAANADAAVPTWRHDAVAHDEHAAMHAKAIAAAPAQARPDSEPPVVAPHIVSPLSHGAVAARAHPAAVPRPVIHVTIDRIDVRAPAVPSHAAPAKRASAAPSVSLADYLRGSGPMRRGGTA